jgi:hypothetical protein
MLLFASATRETVKLRRPIIRLHHEPMTRDGTPILVIDGDAYTIECGDNLPAADLAGAIAEATLRLAEGEINARAKLVPLVKLGD